MEAKEELSIFLSIIVPVYNTEKYLRQCIESILNQTFSDFELILVNDGSTDNSGLICDEYKDTRVKVIHKLHEGTTSARKAGLKISKGTYIGFVDSDDYIKQNMYEKLCEKAIKYNSDIVICDFIKFKDNYKEAEYQNINSGYYDKEKLKNEIYQYMLNDKRTNTKLIRSVLWNKIYKREILENNLYNVDNRIENGEDVVTTYPALLDAKSIYVLNRKALYYYRLNSNSITHRYNENYFNKTLILYNQLKDAVKKKEYDISNQVDEYFINVSIRAIENEMHKDNSKSITKKLTEIKFICNNNDLRRIIKNSKYKYNSVKQNLILFLIKLKATFIIFIFFYILRIKNLFKNN